MIRLHNVSKSFGSLAVLKNVTFDIKPEQSAAVLGPSGSGKTTLLRIIAGTLQPDSGTVEVRSSKIGYVFQDNRLLPWRTAQDNIALPLRAAGWGPREAGEKARSWMDRLGLKGFYNYYPAQLSGGMAQRVSIARAFVLEPEIMLMDEPFSNLDAGLARALLHDLKQVLSDYRAAVVFVTHDLAEALSLTSRVFQLEDGVLKESVIADREKALRNYFNERLTGYP